MLADADDHRLDAADLRDLYFSKLDLTDALEIPFCKICKRPDANKKNPLITTCACDGVLRHAHRECQYAYITQDPFYIPGINRPGHSSDHCLPHCPVCLSDFNLKQLPRIHRPKITLIFYFILLAIADITFSGSLVLAILELSLVGLDFKLLKWELLGMTVVLLGLTLLSILLMVRRHRKAQNKSKIRPTKIVKTKVNRRAESKHELSGPRVQNFFN